MSSAEWLLNWRSANTAWFLLTLIIVFGSALAASIHALLNKQHPSAAFGWVGISLLFPPIGPLLYYMFGINRVYIAARRLDRQSRHGLGAHRPGAHARLRDYRGLVSDTRLMLTAAGDRLSAWPLVPGNAVKPLRNGDKAYPLMLEAIARAESFIYLSTYILETNRVGQRFIDSLGRAVKRGVDVRVLIDGVGEFYAWPRRRPVRLLRKQGVQVARFLPPRLLPPSLQINLRNHRKILVADGKEAFTGGMNIGDRHMAGVGGMADMHFHLTGAICRQIEAVFLSDWAFATGEQTRVSAPRGPEGHAGGVACRCIDDAPTRDSERLATLLIAAVSSARERVLIMTPYFLPAEGLIGVLQAAALRGIKVSIVLPARNNLPYVGWAARHGLSMLIARGVNVYYQPPPFAHTKLFVIDDDYALIGSPNIDPRSLRLNFEMAVEILDTSTSGKLAAHVLDAIQQSRQCTLAELKDRHLPARLRDSFFWLFSPYL